MFTDPNPTSVVPETPDSKPFQPVRLSTASRKITLRSKGSMRGSYVDALCNRQITFESRIEKDDALFIATLPDVVRLDDQPSPVSYIDVDGAIRSHTFDFLVHLADGRRIFVAVKDEVHAKKNDLAGFLAHIAKQIPKSVADGVVLHTEAMLSPAMRFNARLIQAARRALDTGADDAVARISAQVRGRVSIGEIVQATGFEGAGFQAVIRLIARRVFILTADERIDYSTVVAVAAHGSKEAAR